jgi:glycosyltransferase involved in cell wall biosynthesis
MKYFADAGHEVHLISSGKLSGAGIENIKLHKLKRFGPRNRIINYLINSIPLVIQFKRLIKNINPDIIHAHYIMDITLLGAISGFHPFIVTAWGSDVLIAPKKSKVLRWIVKSTLKRADLITCDGENLKEAIIKFDIRPEKIKLIYFGVDTKEFSPQKRDKEFRNKLKAFDSPIVISNRRLTPIYNVESLIKAIPLVLKDFPDTKFVIVGEGQQEDYLKQLAKSIGVWNSVSFTGGLPRNEFVRYVASADIYVSTSLSDGGTAVSIMDAMACELPVVVTDVGDNRKWIKDGENGFVVPIKDPDALAKKIVYLIENEDIRKRFGKNNRKIIEDKANYHKEMEKMEKLYKEILNKG